MHRTKTVKGDKADDTRLKYVGIDIRAMLPKQPVRCPNCNTVSYLRADEFECKFCHHGLKWRETTKKIVVAITGKTYGRRKKRIPCNKARLRKAWDEGR